MSWTAQTAGRGDNTTPPRTVAGWMGVSGAMEWVRVAVREEEMTPQKGCKLEGSGVHAEASMASGNFIQSHFITPPPVWENAP